MIEYGRGECDFLDEFGKIGRLFRVFSVIFLGKLVVAIRGRLSCFFKGSYGEELR